MQALGCHMLSFWMQTVIIFLLLKRPLTVQHLVGNHPMQATGQAGAVHALRGL